MKAYFDAFPGLHFTIEVPSLPATMFS